MQLSRTISSELSPEHKRDRRVSLALVFVWGSALAAWACWWLWPRQVESLGRAIEPAEPFLALIYAAIIIYVVYACIRHANSYRYKGAHPIALSLIFVAGHIVSTTIYHFSVVLRR